MGNISALTHYLLLLLLPTDNSGLGYRDLSCLQRLSRDTTLTAANGRAYGALDVFAHALRYFRHHALQELADQTSTPLLDDDVRWVITVPAIWTPSARQFMRLAALQVATDRCIILTIRYEMLF